jgi:hypothetical protein
MYSTVSCIASELSKVLRRKNPVGIIVPITPCTAEQSDGLERRKPKRHCPMPLVTAPISLSSIDIRNSIETKEIKKVIGEREGQSK